MSLALISLGQILTMLFLMAAGLACTKMGLLDEAVNKKLSNLLLMVINPIIILLAYQREYETELLHRLLLSLLLGLLTFIISIILIHLIYKKRNNKDFGIEKFACVYSNAGFLGIPLINGIFGYEGVFYLTGYITVFFIFFWTHGQIVMGGKKDFSSVRRSFVSPPMIAVYLGFALFMLRIELPEFLMSPLKQLGNLNTPLAMLVAGSTIYGIKVLDIIKDRRIYAVCTLKLLIIPGLVILIFSPFNIPQTVLGTIVILTACPSAANLILLAYKYEKDHVYASQIFTASTILSMATIPLLLIFL